MRRLIVDSNSLWGDEIERYLKEDRSNFVYIPEMVVQEAFTTSDWKKSLESWDVLKKYVDQVFFLKANNDVRNLTHVDSSGECLVDQSATADFRAFVDSLSRSGVQDGIEKLVTDNRSASRERLGRMSSGNGFIQEGLMAYQEIFTESERKHIRNGRPLSALEEKIGNLIVGYFYECLAGYPNQRFIAPQYRYNSFLFRHSVAAFAYFLNWLKSGSAGEMNFDKITNDQIDLSVIAYSSYFDGVLTRDGKMSKISKIADEILKLESLEFLVKMDNAGY